MDAAVAHLGPQCSGVHQHHRAAEAAVAHQQVRAEADEKQNLPLPLAAEEDGQILRIGRRVEAVRAAPGAPADVPRHRLVVPQPAPQLAELDWVSHVHARISARFAGTLPIEPAPMVTTTSPSFALRRIAAGMSAMSSTNTGSTLPYTRNARASV